MDCERLPTGVGRRSSLLAAWGSAWLAGEVGFDEAVDAVVDGDAHHEVRLGDPTGEAMTLGWALGRLRAVGTRSLLVVLPAPGDPAGISGGELGRAALAAGEAVLTVGAGEGLGLVPWISCHGSDAEGVVKTVSWRGYPLTDLRPAAAQVESVGTAAAALSETLRDVTSELTDLDVARWRPEIAGTLDALRSTGRAARPLLALPPGAEPRARQLLDLAERLAVVVELAGSDDGAAVAGFETRARTAALRRLAAAIRHARTAAVNAAPYGIAGVQSEIGGQSPA